MFLTRLVVGDLQSNCYILAADTEAIAIDPGAEAHNILTTIRQNNLKLKWIVCTHSHYDHIIANADLIKETGCKVYMHPIDIELIEKDIFGMNMLFDTSYEIIPLNEGEIKLGNMDLEIIHTPGHSPGSVCVKYNNYLFSGDLLFAGSVGRSDFPGSSSSDLQESLEKIKKLDDGLVVLPGHGEETTIGKEKLSNPFLN